jgi:hypothetical protein
MNPQLNSFYCKAIDFTTYVKLAAPDFPKEANLTCELALDRILTYLDSLREKDDDPTAKQWLRLAWNEVKAAEKSFEQKNDREGRKMLDSARTYLQYAAERKSMEPTIFIDEPGIAE